MSKYCSQKLTLVLTVFTLLIFSSGCRKVNQGFKANTSRVQAQSQLTIKASLEQDSRPLDANFMCFNANTLWVKSWADPRFQETVNQLNPRMLRIPGGTESQYWDWGRGRWIENISGIRHPYMAQVFRRLEREGKSPAKLEDFKTGLDSTGTIPLFVLNIVTSDLDYQLAMLKQARKIGIPVKYIQIGNEPYIPFEDNQNAFPTPSAYATLASQWASAIKKEFPQAKIAVVGVNPMVVERVQRARLNNWNENIVNTALPEANALTVHVYQGHGLNSSINSNTDYPFFTAEEVPQILAVPFRNWQRIQNNNQWSNIPKNKEIWITEYNFFSSMHNSRQREKPRMVGSWTHGLYTLAMSLLFLEEQRISHICNHVLVGDSSFAAILANENVFVNPSQKVKGTKLSLTATGSALRFLGDATEGMSQANLINFPNSPTLTGKNNFTYSALYGWRFTNGKDDSAVIMNISNQELTLDVSLLLKGTIKYQQIYGEPRLLVTGPGVLKEQQGNTIQTLILPPYSVTLLENN